jgi:hypothetical protein
MLKSVQLGQLMGRFQLRSGRTGGRTNASKTNLRSRRADTGANASVTEALENFWRGQLRHGQVPHWPAFAGDDNPPEACFVSAAL